MIGIGRKLEKLREQQRDMVYRLLVTKGPYISGESSLAI